MRHPSSDRPDHRAFPAPDWYRVIDGAAEVAVVTMDLDGRVVDWSPQAEAIFGFSRNEVIGQFLASLIVPEHNRDDHWAELEQFRQTGVCGILNQRLEISAVRRDGLEFPVEVMTTLLRMGDNPLFICFLQHGEARDGAESRRTSMALEGRLLHQVTTLSTSAESFEDALTRCVEVLCSVTGWPVGHVLLPDDQGTGLKSSEIWYFDDEPTYRGLCQASRDRVFQRGEGLPGLVWETGEAVWSANVQK
ncbi:MAG: PAS domain S-box protein, partial [Planctomycetaceae bacterium]|nr:PAS domain S-box protein [Planctomycetaceae bacterium]